MLYISNGVYYIVCEHQKFWGENLDLRLQMLTDNGLVYGLWNAFY